MARGSGVCGLEGCDCEDAAFRLQMPYVRSGRIWIDPITGEFVGYTDDFREWCRNS